MVGTVYTASGTLGPSSLQRDGKKIAHVKRILEMCDWLTHSQSGYHILSVMVSEEASQLALGPPGIVCPLVVVCSIFRLRT